MNATVQCLRAIPELQTALSSYSAGTQGGSDTQLTAEMRRLYEGMAQTTDRYIPALFLQRLRLVAPQFAEQRPGVGFVQQGEQINMVGDSSSQPFRCRRMSGGHLEFPPPVISYSSRK